MRWLLLGLLVAALPTLVGAQALQNYIVPTAPPGTSNNQAASTAFVQNAIVGIAFDVTAPHTWTALQTFSAGLNVGVSGTGSSVPSMPITLTAHNAGGGVITGSMWFDELGAMHFNVPVSVVGSQATLNVAPSAGLSGALNFYEGPVTVKFQLQKDAANNLTLIDNVRSLNALIISSTGDMSIGEAGKILNLTAASVKFPGVPTSAGAGGLFVCVDTAGVLYKKATCP